MRKCEGCEKCERWEWGEENQKSPAATGASTARNAKLRNEDNFYDPTDGRRLIDYWEEIATA